MVHKHMQNFIEILVDRLIDHFFSKMHIFEPVPEFSHKLSEAWRINIIQNNWDVTVHEYGLGAFTR